jgi:uncharacterized phage protein gp47/JayE
MSGVDATGFTPKSLEEILEDIESEQLANIAADLDISPDQPIGQINGIFAKKLAELWEALATCYGGFNRGAAEGVLLDAIGLLTGTPRLDATKSQVNATVNLNASTTLPVGSIANVTDQPTNRWLLRTAVTSTTAGNYAAIFDAEVTGPQVANSGTLEQITVPVIGWNSVTNAEDADLGTNIESDAAYRIRQQEELSAPGACTVDAIRADVLQVDGVIECKVFENTSLVTDGDGLPGKSFEVVLYDGSVPDADDDEVAQAIWDSKPSGIEAYGSSSGTAVDSEGVEHTVEFSRATGVNVYLFYTLDVDPLKYPVDGDDQVEAAAIAKGATALGMGDDVIALVFRAQALSVAGVNDVTAFTLGTAPSPVGTANLSITSRQIALLDTSRISVVS